MDKAGWTTHCFGRFLVDLPQQANTRASFKVWGNEIISLSETPVTFAARVDKREQELRLQPHSSEGNAFIRKNDLSNGSVSLLSWRNLRSTSAMWLDAYLIGSGTWRAFERSALIDPAREHIAMEFTERLSRNIRGLLPNEIPTEPGFCIDRGYIAGNEYQSESFRVGVTLRSHPGMQISIWSSTGAAEDTLLERAGGFLRAEMAGALAGMKTLRKGRRNVGPIQAEEYLIAASDKGQRVYGFKWEAQGKNRSLSEPNLSVELNVLERDPDYDGDPPPPAFESDEQALRLWDAIIESIRLRPGAA